MVRVGTCARRVPPLGLLPVLHHNPWACLHLHLDRSAYRGVSCLVPLGHLTQWIWLQLWRHGRFSRRPEIRGAPQSLRWRGSSSKAMRRWIWCIQTYVCSPSCFSCSDSQTPLKGRSGTAYTIRLGVGSTDGSRRSDTRSHRRRRRRVGARVSRGWLFVFMSLLSLILRLLPGRGRGCVCRVVVKSSNQIALASASAPAHHAARLF